MPAWEGPYRGRHTLSCSSVGMPARMHPNVTKTGEEQELGVVKGIKVFLTIGFSQSTIPLYICKARMSCLVRTHKTYQNYL
jgi:hypothetical protein